MKKNEIYTITIDALNSDGAGVGRLDGEVIFVPYALPGETIKALIIKTAKNYAVGKLLQILLPSKDRVSPPCPYFYRCGGCDFQHLEYLAQLSLKSSSALKNLQKLSGLALTCGQIIPADSVWNYRNKAQFPVGTDKTGEPVLGFFSPHSHTLVSIERCMLQQENCNLIIPAVKKAIKASGNSVYNEVTHSGTLRHCIVRTGKYGLMVILVTNGKLIKTELFIHILHKELPQMTALIQNINTQKGNIILGKECYVLWGNSFIEDELCAIRFRLKPLAFLQVNPLQAQKLYTYVTELAALTGKETVFDAYCGIGIMSLMLAKKAHKVIGVEIVLEAIETAKKSAELNGITNAEFYVGACEKILPELIKAHQIPDILVVDPPRAGCEQELLKTIADAAIQKIIYVSCNPATLARDIKILTEYGYHASPVTFVDMFCQTKHIESVTLLSRKKM